MPSENDERQVFIIDQHASDERYRLEMLQKELTFTTQTMLVPVRVDSGLDDQLYVMDNLERIKENGFSVRIEVTDVGDRSLHLTTAPCTAGIQLGEQDLREMISQMRTDEYSGLHCLGRVADTLAYKACRSAIMIGDSLNTQQMTQVVRNLAGLQKPWVHDSNVFIQTMNVDLRTRTTDGATLIHNTITLATGSLANNGNYGGNVILFPIDITDTNIPSSYPPENA